MEALSKLNHVINFELTILGDGPFGYLIDPLTKEYHLDGKIKWKGMVPLNEVIHAYQEHDVFIFCGLRDSCPAQLLEAMASGLPIITLDHQGPRLFVPDNAGFKIAVESIETTTVAISQAVEEYHKYPDLRVQHGNFAKTYALKHSWDNKIKEMLVQYRRLLGNEQTLNNKKSAG